MDFAQKRCVPCEGGVPRMTRPAVDEALRSLDGWDAREDATQLHKHYRFKDFVAAMAFVNALAALAEREGHHPDFCLRAWNTVDVTLWTHAIGGLSENDFIVAAKADGLPESRP
jgi:4a-hydroxytetrahydrobiopterin dehydratase